MTSVRAAVVLAVLALASSALAQPQAVVRDARLAAVRDRLESAVGAARDEGLPHRWLLHKIAEGLAKRVPPPRIAAAVEALLGRMRVADSITRGVTSSDRPRLLRATVDALAAGAPEPALRGLVREVAPDDVLEAVTTVAELVERDFGGEASVRASLAAWRSARRGGLRALLDGARRIRAGDRDLELLRVGRDVRGSGIDRGRTGRDHDRDGRRGNR